MEPQSSERRLGVRRDVSVVIAWDVASRSDHDAGQPRRLCPSPPNAEMWELSVTGATALAPRRVDLQIGSRIAIEVLGETGTVIIRRITACSDPQLSIYGVEFAEPNSPLTGRLYDTFLSDHALALKSAEQHSRTGA